MGIKVDSYTTCNITPSEDEKDHGRGMEMERNYNVSLKMVKKDRREGVKK